MGNNEVVVRNEAGDLEIIDLTTGEVVTNNASPPATIYSFSYEKALYICQLVKEGKSMTEVSDVIQVPSHIISHWQRTQKMFAEELKIARKERGEVYHDRAMEIAKNAGELRYGKDDVPSATLAAKLYQWGAEKAKPEAYGKVVTHEGSTEKPILMRVINTGISRAKADVIPDAVITKEVIDVSREENESRTNDEASEDESPL